MWKVFYVLLPFAFLWKNNTFFIKILMHVHQQWNKYNKVWCFNYHVTSHERLLFLAVNKMSDEHIHLMDIDLLNNGFQCIQLPSYFERLSNKTVKFTSRLEPFWTSTSRKNKTVLFRSKLEPDMNIKPQICPLFLKIFPLKFCKMESLLYSYKHSK